MDVLRVRLPPNAFPLRISSLTIPLLQENLDRILLNPQYADYLALIKSARNGAVYGAKVRFPHALVYAFTRLH